MKDIVQCECGAYYRKGNDQVMCWECTNTAAPIKVCIECENDYTDSIWRPWCQKKCYDGFFETNPQPNYLEKDWDLRDKGLCFACTEPLDNAKRKYGYCSATCHGIYHIRAEYRRREQRLMIFKEKGEFAAMIFEHAQLRQWSRLHPYDRNESDPNTPEYLKEYHKARGKEKYRMKIRKQLGLPEDAPISGTMIPATTELPIKLWLEANNIVFERQRCIEIGITRTYVDFFIPIPDSETGFCLYCDGDYWHGPEFPATQEKDLHQVRELEKLGHVVIRLWETEIQNGVRPVAILEYFR